nr:VOC family protein [Microlunatus speluncae]
MPPTYATDPWRGTLGFELRNDVGQGTMRWLTVGPAGQPETSILLAPPVTDDSITEDERGAIESLVAKGVYGWIILGTDDLDGTFARVRESGAEIEQEPTEQPWGVRDCVFRDPAGNTVRFNESR